MIIHMVYYNQGFLFTGSIVVFTVIPIRVEFINFSLHNRVFDLC